MSGEGRIVKDALLFGPAVAGAGAIVLGVTRGSAAAASVLIASALILGNAGLSAGISAVAGRITPTGPAMVSLPSFALRLSLLFSMMAWLTGKSFVDETVFAISFACALVFTLVMEARAWRRTPWLALTFDSKEQQ